MKPKIDYTLYVCTDRDLMSSATMEESVEQAIRGGATLIQLRDKNVSGRTMYETALSIKKITDRYGVGLIINDRVDIAKAVDATGVHLGQSDLPCEVARTILGEDKIIGVSSARVDEAMQAQADGADYIGVGAMFTTSTKQNTRPVTMELLDEIRQAVAIPIVVIGGIALSNAEQFTNTGVNGLAVVSSVVAQPDVELAARQMRAAFLGQGR